MGISPVKPRICHLVGHLNVGGAERQVVNLLNAMADCHPAVILISPGQRHDLRRDLDSRVQVIALPCRLSRLPYDLWRLRRVLRQLRPTILHSHMFWPNVFGALGAGLARVPVLVTSEHGRNPWKRVWHRWLERYLITPRAARRICVSEDIRAVRVEGDGLPPEKFVVMPNGTAVPARAERQWRDPMRVLAVGRLIPAKDYGTLLQAFAMVLARGTNAYLDIAGDGPLRSELERLRLKLGLQDRVRFLGSRGDVPDLMRESNVLVISSVREGQPLVLLEAMAAAMPIVATAVGGIPQTLEHGREGVLVEPGNSVALSAAIDLMLHEPARATEFGRHARERVIRDFSIAAVSAEHLALYESCLGEAVAC